MDRKYPGVMKRGDSVQITFAYHGQRIRETIRVGKDPTKTIMKELADKRHNIIYQIKIGTFNYAEHFPESKNVFKFSKNKGGLITVKQSLNAWLKKKQRRCQYSTIRGYNSIVGHHLIPSFGHLTLDQLTTSDLYEWLDTLKISNKRINNILSPLRQTFRDAYCDGLIDTNPMDRFESLSITHREADPFSPEEIQLILDQLDGQCRNLIKFAFWTGLRTSELIALKWEHVNLTTGRAHIRSAIVYGREKQTKTRSGMRDLILQPEAIRAIKSQHEFTQKHGEFVFHDPLHNRRWKDDQCIRKRVWKPALQSAKIEYRNPYQTRHTFASMMLSKGMNPMQVAQQMGHKDWGMIRMIYGRWISQV